MTPQAKYSPVQTQALITYTRQDLANDTAERFQMGFAVGWIGATIYLLARDLALIAAVLMMDTIT